MCLIIYMFRRTPTKIALDNLHDYVVAKMEHLNAEFLLKFKEAEIEDLKKQIKVLEKKNKKK